MNSKIRSSRLYAGGILLCLLLGGSRGMAQQDDALQVRLSAGYGQQNFRWSIAGNSAGQNPNIYSELKWKDLKGPSIGASARWNVWRRWVLMGEYSKLFIRSGSVSDIDYQENNRQDASYHGYFNSNQGSEETWSAAIGYMVVKKKTWRLMLAAGYGESRESLFLLDNDPGFGGILNSTYKAHWNGPVGKAIATVRLIKRLSMEGNLTYYQVNYNSRADWNLIETFRQPDSFNDMAKGYGVQTGISLKYKLTHLIGLTAGGRYAYWRTGTGTDQLFLATGETDDTQLNGVSTTEMEWGVGVMIGL